MNRTQRAISAPDEDADDDVKNKGNTDDGFAMSV
jgi:hypothetical protein